MAYFYAAGVLTRGCLLELWAGLGWDMVMTVDKEVRRGSSVVSTGDMGRDEGRLQALICCSASDETKGFVWGTKIVQVCR